jgi:hypothetical protein
MYKRPKLMEVGKARGGVSAEPAGKSGTAPEARTASGSTPQTEKKKKQMFNFLCNKSNSNTGRVQETIRFHHTFKQLNTKKPSCTITLAKPKKRKPQACKDEFLVCGRTFSC